MVYSRKDGEYGSPHSTGTFLCGILCQHCSSVFSGRFPCSKLVGVDNTYGALYTVFVHDYFIRSTRATTMMDLNTLFNNATIPLAVVIVAMAIVVTLMQRNIHRK